jgi:uncharacterized protein with NRDE domain
MCLILFAYGAHPNYPFILVANRDEFYARPASAADFWADAPSVHSRNSAVLAGRDLQAGGTWCGVAKNGRLAALTNYRDFHAIKENAPSRGNLTTWFLTRRTLRSKL